MFDAPSTAHPYSETDSDLPIIDESHAASFIASSCFTTGPVGRIGIELEWLVHEVGSPATPVTVARSQAATEGRAVLANGTRLTPEPGGQLELSSSTYASVSGAIAGLAADLETTRSILARAGLELSGDGLDPLRPPVRSMSLPRYAAMERYLDGWGPENARPMMCSTASVQVNLDAGRDLDEIQARWRLIRSLSPILVAAFANSPFRLGRPTGWFSTRQALWTRLDPARTRWPAEPDDDPIDSYAQFALDAPLMCVRSEGPNWDAPPGLTFRQWIRGDGQVVPARTPTIDDLMYHLTTLFPPVRPRGWFELRFIDAQPADDWQVAAAVIAALVDDPAAGDAARLVIAPLAKRGDVWTAAARDALSDPDIRAGAQACFGIALDALRRLGADRALIERVAEWTRRHVDAGRSPAEYRLESWHRTGSTALASSGSVRG